MVAQHNNKMIRTFIDLFFKGAIGISILDFVLITITETITMDDIIGKWLQILFTVIGIIYFISSWPHKRKMQKLEREKCQAEIEKLKRESN